MRDRWITNPFSKEKIRLLAASPDALRLEVSVPTDMVSPPPHIHLHEAESFHVTEGQVTISIDGRERTLGAGESTTMPAGVPHTWRNSGEGVLRLAAEFRPAGQMQSFFETFCGLASERRCDGRGQPSLLQIAAAAEFWDIYLAGPPIFVQRLLFAILRPIAWLRGYRATYPRFQNTLG